LDFAVKSLLNLKGDLIEQRWYQVLFYSHVTGGAIAIAVGGFQFSERLLRTRLKWHRVIGKVYIGAIAWSGTTGLIIALLAYGGWLAKLGFVTMAIGWLYTTTKGYLTIRAGKVLEHQRWMIRSYAFTLAALSFRLWLLGGPVFDLDFVLVYRIASWASWVGNIVLAEWLLAKGYVGNQLIKAPGTLVG
ncbi:MAG: DUF2306 domain-containing protein, partial [Bacteroidota bacterium]